MEATQELEYIIWRLEKSYFEKNPDVIESGNLCLQAEGLPCNCITGLIVNYAAYVAMQDPAYLTAFSVDESGSYLRCSCGDRGVCPILKSEMHGSDYLLSKRLCGETKQEQAYIRFKRYRDLAALEKILSDYEGNRGCIPPNRRYSLEFCIRFMSAMRTKELRTANHALLFMAAYMFPYRTWDIIENREKQNGADKTWLHEFLKRYYVFLESVGGDADMGFLQRLVKAFRGSLQLDVQQFIEEAVERDELFGDSAIRQTLIGAYRDNMKATSRRSGEFYKVCVNMLKDLELWKKYYDLAKKTGVV